MKIIVPLAGPDFERPDGSVKSERLLGGTPILRAALESRPWWRQGIARACDLSFVLRDTGPSRRFATERLQVWYPGSAVSFLGAGAQGAALSSLVGLAPAAGAKEPVCIDLADIIFDCDGPIDWFSDPQVGGIAMTFSSNRAEYSFLRRDEDGRVVEAVEKTVVSSEASAGVYIFKSPAVYMMALSYILENREKYMCRGLFFVCPLLNGVIHRGMDVLGVPVYNVLDVKMGE